MNPVLIVTRPALQAGAFARAVASRWSAPLRIIQSPLIAIEPRLVRADLTGVTDLIFTSVHGVAAAQRLGLLAGLTAWCVGQKTAAAARAAGFLPITGPGDADGLVTMILAAAPNGICAHIRGEHARGDICARLTDAGLRCIDIPAYDQTALILSNEAKNAVKGKEPVLFPLFSPRSATILSDQGPFAAQTHVIAMSEAVIDAVGFSASRLHLAARPDEAAMIAASLQVLQGLTERRV
ncbi:uroporphyrinogen-III synthase [Yoonia sp. BS5-3]|uniref:Uroporphyrinogen-III synthase n=1 Tax=Yoonia phaeophyticola TaxID=3137369 RepID=A0ABZ2VAN8_9RHOB